MDEKSLEKLIESHRELTLQLEQLGKIVLEQIERERINSLRDLLLLKVIITEIADDRGEIKKRLQKRLDVLLLSIGDNRAMCEAIAQAHAAIEGAR